MTKFKWVIEIEVDEMWVADGFDLDDEGAHLMIQNRLPFATPDETSAKVIKSPNQKLIRKAQGYDE